MRKLVFTAIALAIGSSPVLAAPATRGEVQLAQIEPAQYAEGVISVGRATHSFSQYLHEFISLFSEMSEAVIHSNDFYSFFL